MNQTHQVAICFALKLFLQLWNVPVCCYKLVISCRSNYCIQNEQRLNYGLFELRSPMFAWQPPGVCLHRSTSKSTEPFNGRFCTARQWGASAAVSHRPSCNQTALLCTAGWRRWKRDSAEQHCEDGPKWWRLLLSSVSCHMSLVPFAWRKGDTDACNCEPGWVVICEDERRNSESHTRLSKISTWDEEAACHGPEDCVRRREDLSFTFSPQHETGWLLLWNFIAAPAANISLWFKEKMSSLPEVKKACSSSSPD